MYIIFYTSDIITYYDTYYISNNLILVNLIPYKYMYISNYIYGYITMLYHISNQL